ncbi:hypothetical protein TRIHO_13920 [Tritonibacter horizontis]|uniref:Uncharacterized protein n=1 Tax=Tritonibacter horizontis TaxID=1768241 RepID=A0A132C087_9RHOB|nr:hypothetical protein TRIHO_13920 [Tritonibacter horizontis]
MLSYDWIVLISLGLDRWQAPRPPRSGYEIEQEEVWQHMDSLDRAARHARRHRQAAALRRGLRQLAMLRFLRLRSRTRHPCAPPQRPASRV